ncbi:MAG: MBL fold metallo-hydrolase [Candidatus Giovannonibacteria bacterium]|nr:MBL fold metallo-hydrolase [Candidatus Giovannonibacteria bacterium]
MKITKHLHSCLLVEDAGKRILIDPGNYTFEEGGLDVGKLEKLDLILITHEHLDHAYPPLIKKVLERFPEVKILANLSAKNFLMKEGISVFTDNFEGITLADAPHEVLLGGRTAENSLLNIFGRLTHPGDSLRFERTFDVLALPIQAPWGSAVASIEKAALLKPKIVIPIHDWHWKDSARKKMYEMAKNYLAEKEIELRGLEIGEELII